MSGPDPDQPESSGSYSGGAATAKTQLETSNGADAKPMDNKKMVFVNKQYHDTFGGTTKFEGRIKYWRKHSRTLLPLANPNSMFELQDR